MLAGIVVVRCQPLPVLHHRLDRLGTVPKGMLELLSLRDRLFAALGVHHGLEMALNLALLFPAHRVDHVEHLVIPAQLLLSLGINLAHRRP